MKIPDGRFLGEYISASVPFASEAGVKPFSILTGSANKIIKLKKIKVSGIHLTAVEFLTLLVSKYSTATTGGTSTGEAETPLASTYPASGATILSYTVGGTVGTLVGNVASATVLGEATVEAAGIKPSIVEFDFEGKEPILISSAEQIGVRWGAAPASAVTVSVEYFWEEYSN